MGVYAADVPVETFIIAWNWGRYLGEDALKLGVDVCVSSWRRAAPDTIPGLAKASGNYLSSQLTKMEARLDRYAEGIMLDNAGHVSEGSGENLFIVRDGVIYTATLGASILNGITRDSVMVIARDLGYEVREETTIPREMLYIADEAVLLGNRRGDHADSLGRSDSGRGREAGADHARDPGAVPGHLQGRDRGPLRLAHYGERHSDDCMMVMLPR